MTTATNATARVVLDELVPASEAGPARVRVSVPGYAYRLELAVSGPTAALEGRRGRRVEGVVRGQALRAWRAAAGGCFIEPVWGVPRIVQGRVLAVDVDANAVLLDLVFPAWITMEPSQPAGGWHTGDMLNFYVASGMTFTPSR